MKRIRKMKTEKFSLLADEKLAFLFLAEMMNPLLVKPFLCHDYSLQ